ncbi:hypothetical protein [Streptomyces sp. NBC_01243]|uniref:hypothetical protein n=1 Tax=Streptomyces sp. NBC_01243 TaxID=2903796 RepID=UPI002E113A5E|nr:hypothetical protein OG348_04260 [Streptomyces sp. NBC_01243]
MLVADGSIGCGTNTPVPPPGSSSRPEPWIDEILDARRSQRLRREQPRLLGPPPHEAARERRVVPGRVKRGQERDLDELLPQHPHRGLQPVHPRRAPAQQVDERGRRSSKVVKNGALTNPGTGQGASSAIGKNAHSRPASKGSPAGTATLTSAVPRHEDQALLITRASSARSIASRAAASSIWVCTMISRMRSRSTTSCTRSPSAEMKMRTFLS